MAAKTFLRRCYSSLETVTETKISSLLTNSCKVTITIPKDSVHNVEGVVRLDKFLQKDCKKGTITHDEARYFFFFNDPYATQTTDFFIQLVVWSSW